MKTIKNGNFKGLVACSLSETESNLYRRYKLGQCLRFALENRNNLTALEIKPQVQIYPNPATDRIAIAVAGQKVSSVVVKSVDGSVQKVLSYSTDLGCDISSLPLGIYLVDVLVDEKYISTVKFIKIK